MAPVKLGYTKDGKVNERHLNFYRERAKFLGAVIPEPLYIDKGLREIPTQLGIDNNDKLEGLQKLTNLIHENGAKAIAHLNHPGRMANPKIPENYFVSSTDRACENGGATPKKLAKEDLPKVTELFVEAAKRAKKANFDFIELQFGHGYLLAQFISPAVNDRTDEYGGSFANRIRFPLEVLNAIKSAIEIPVIARISGDEMTETGFHLPEMLQFAKILQENGIAALHISAGTVCSTPPWYFQHMFVPKGKTWEIAKKFKEKVEIPVIAVGQINEMNDVNKILDNKMADFVAIGRAFVADPDFAGKYLGKVKGNIRPCLACSEGCLGGVKSGKGLGCMVNPLVGREDEVIKNAEVSKRIAIVGGGLAGLEAALVLQKRGHRVTIFEKDKIGGQFNLAYLPPHKQSLKKLVDYYKKEISDLQIEVIFKEAKKDDLRNFDEIVIATGSKPAVPPIKGLEKYWWAEILEDENLPKNKRILIIGGGLIGTEAANKLLQNGNRIFIVEMLGDIAGGMEMIEQKLTMKALRNENVSIFVNTLVKEVDGKDVIIERENHEEKIENIDILVLATGMKSYNPFEKVKLDKPAPIIGDAAVVGKAQDAIKSGFEIGKKL